MKIRRDDTTEAHLSCTCTSACMKYFPVALHLKLWHWHSFSCVWRGGVVVRASDLQLIGRRFESRPLRFT